MTIKSCIVVGLLSLPVYADSQKERNAAAAVAAANAQHLRDLATIDRLTKENISAASISKSNRVAINKLGNDSKDRASSSLVHQDENAVTTRNAISPIVPKIDALTDKIDAISPYDYRPIYLAAIPAVVAMFTGIVSVFLALITRSNQKIQGATIDKVHALTNSAMTAALEGTAMARRANATSLKALYVIDPTLVNKTAMEMGERVAVEAEQRFDIHQQTQDLLNKN